MKKLIIAFIAFSLFFVSCSSTKYVECKDPVKIKGKVYCKQ